MLSAASKDVIRATLPAVGAAIDRITPLFYRKLFAAHPELERDLFNRGNQLRGVQQQALARSIAVFATLQLDPDPDQVHTVLSRIANKHASLGITADQYAVVHEHLFAAIVEVLGAAVTPAVAAAWDELYWLMAETLISMEKGLYAAAGVTPGYVWRTVRVRERRHESADSVSFVLTSTDGAPLPHFVPGQYLSVATLGIDGARQIRQYSLCSPPRIGTWRITVKRIRATLHPGSVVPSGEVSNFLYYNVFEGDEVYVTTPFGDLTLPEEASAPLLLASAGIGCTPMISMLHHLVDTKDQRPVAVLHADRSPSAHAHRAELATLVDQLPGGVMYRWYEELDRRAPGGGVYVGYANLAPINLAPDTRAVLCGPLPFMIGLRDALLNRNLAAENIHYEVFGPISWQTAPV
ncbi:FAD-binding oxidoreductase [Aldersonia sp. NBC_00410]|uniref:globin domain-containing protein n=1 Tax=Aldersonia sp. NBC_00410 TaxID=2975954 RepID=UPI00225538D7|nr:globin domain-containing protein [Aldersonia sp. NBC_00410]MCX5043591.1 FAD-binding oxidoreductase [Aldersonia sp. NBC_00410]